MTDDQRKKYEEAAKQYMERIGYAQDSTMIAFFLAGCEFASKEFKDMDACVEELQEKLKKFESMNYAIKVLKNAFDEREIRMRNALNMSCSASDTGYYRDRYIELERQVKDLEKAIKLLSEQKSEE